MYTLKTDSIDLWYCPYESIKDPLLLAQYNDILAPQEQSRRQRFHFDHDQHQYLVTRALVRTVLSAYHDKTHPKEWLFTKNSYGKPAICESILADQLFFNVSHTKGLIIMAVTSQADIGIDVEWINHFGALHKLAERHFSATEILDFHQQLPTSQTDYFYELWTLKESYIKAHGQGLSIPLDQFEFSFESDHHITAKFHTSIKDDPMRWHFWQFQPNSPHKIALAVRPHNNIHSFQVNCFEAIPFNSIHPIELPIYRQSKL